MFDESFQLEDDDDIFGDDDFPVEGQGRANNFYNERYLDEYYEEVVMQDEGNAEWTLERGKQKYNFLRQKRIKNKDVAFLMRVRSRI